MRYVHQVPPKEIWTRQVQQRPLLLWAAKERARRIRAALGMFFRSASSGLWTRLSNIREQPYKRLARDAGGATVARGGDGRARWIDEAPFFAAFERPEAEHQGGTRAWPKQEGMGGLPHARNKVII